MNFLSHPIYTLLTLGTCAYLSMANARGLSLVHTVNPFNWTSGGGRGSMGWSGHGGSHFSHK